MPSRSAHPDERIKRLIDLAVAVPVLLLLLPLLIVLLLLVRADSPGNPLFRQARVGRGGQTFTLYKLRSFHRHRHGIFPDEEIRSGDARVTRIGGILRRTKLDELPQLVNVVLGEMSLVGPRPDLPIQAQRYGALESVRLHVRPGITGLAQISGNTWLSWPQRIRLDRWYVENRSTRLDLLILLYTIPVALRGERPSDDALYVRRRFCIAVEGPNA